MSERRPSVVVVSGPSGAGKSTVLARVLAELDRIRFSVSHTTRPPRPGETGGVDYHFVDASTFGRLVEQGRFLEWAEVHGERYGTSRDEYERALREGVDLLLDLDVQGAEQLHGRFPDAVTVFVLPPSYQDLESRLRLRRAEDEASLRRRLKAAWEEASLFSRYDYVIVNEDLDRSVLDLKSIIRAARCRTSRVEALARSVLSTFRPPEQG